MPFLQPNENGDRPLDELSLAQRPIDGVRFDLREPFVYLDPSSGDRSAVPAGVRTDLASVPQALWGFIASYGRQSAPAVLHDHRSVLAAALAAAGDRRGALARRRVDDRVFRTALREQRVPLVRAWLMWAWVSADRERQFGGVAGGVFVAQAVLGTVLLLVAAVLGWWQPAWFLLLPLPALAALPWRRLAGLQLLLSYGSALLAPLVALHLVAVLPFRLLEALVELLTHGEPAGVWRPTLRGEASGD